MAANQVIEVDFRSKRVTRRREVLSEEEVPVLELPADWRNLLTHSFDCQLRQDLFGDKVCVCNHGRLVAQLARLERLAEELAP